MSIETVNDMENILIAQGFITEKPQGKEFDEQLSQLDKKTIEILKIFVKQVFSKQVVTDSSKSVSPELPILDIAFNRVKLDRLFWLCYFMLQKESMENDLKQLFSSDNSFDLDERELRHNLPPVSMDILSKFLLENFSCHDGKLSWSAEALEEFQMCLKGFTLPTDFYYSNKAENDQKMLVERNSKWIKVLAEHIEKRYLGPILVAVGHMHLAGRTGLLCLLQNEGYTISQYEPYFKNESTGFIPFDSNLLFNRHAEQFKVKTIYDEIDKQLKTILGAVPSDKYEINSLVQDYAYSWPCLVFSNIYPDKKTVPESISISRNTVIACK